jgi:hypothetical protein
VGDNNTVLDKLVLALRLNFPCVGGRRGNKLEGHIPWKADRGGYWVYNPLRSRFGDYPAAPSF